MSKKNVTTKSAPKAQAKKTPGKKPAAATGKKAAIKVGDLVRVPYHDGSAEGTVAKIEKGLYHVLCTVGSGKAEVECKRNEVTPLAAETTGTDQVVEAALLGNLAEGITVPVTAKSAKTKKPKAAGKSLSGLDAVAQVLQEAGVSMKAKAMVDKALAEGLWQTGGQTPHATVYAAIIREIAAKGPASRFVKTGKGEFAYNTERKEA
jgi:hypothetical protein